ncbi:hypothetical protein E0M28_23675 [Bacillus toyonensis]|nr:hypothetical protein E0M28_23675 [Bacillus toyonensis]
MQKKITWKTFVSKRIFVVTVGTVTEEIIRTYIVNQFIEGRNKIFKIEE